eukprot:9449021-Karenia_brevis.AAC.2
MADSQNILGPLRPQESRPTTTSLVKEFQGSLYRICQTRFSSWTASLGTSANCQACERHVMAFKLKVLVAKTNPTPAEAMVCTLENSLVHGSSQVRPIPRGPIPKPKYTAESKT